MSAFDPKRTSERVRGTDTMEYQDGLPGLVRLGAGELDHLAPLLGLIGDELAEVGGRARKHRAAHVGDPRLDLGIGEARIDLLVELVDDFGGRVLGRAEALHPLAS